MSNDTHKHQPGLNHLIRQIFLFATIIAAMALSGCAANSVPIYVSNGKEYGKIQETFRNRWWNHYERGLSFAEGKYYKEAKADLQEAIKQRKKDQRMARTYGMHFIDYFPHRELGLIYYQTQDMEAAIKELEISMEHFPSAKARFYLDRVRKELIRKKGEEPGYPELALDFEKHEIWTRDDHITISGVARDKHYISDISIRGIPFFLEESQKQAPFTKIISLSQGRHAVEVAARNLSGKETKQTLILNIDQEGPVITIDELWIGKDGNEPGVALSGSVYDKAGISELSINGHPIKIQKNQEIFFTRSILTDKEDLELMTADQLGNTTSARIPLHSVTVETGNLKLETGNWKLETQNYDKPVSSFKFQVSNFQFPLLASLDSDAFSFLTASLFGSRDKTGPGIKLKGWTDTQTVFLDKIYLEGKVSDENKIVSLTVNHIPVLRREGQYVFFGNLVELREGKNDIMIKAEDEAGNRTEKKISVTRKIPKALQLEERLSMTIFPFVQKGELSELSSSLQDNLINALVTQNRFRIIERDKLDAILHEQKLSSTQLIDRNTALKLGKLIAARSVLTGTIIETVSGIEIVARLIDTETSEILATEDAYDELKDLPGIRTLSEGIAVKFHRDFPLLDGMVVQQRDNHIFIDIGKDIIRRQRRFIVYHEEPLQHPATGKILGMDNVIKGHARITQVMPDLSKARIVDGDYIKPLDKVISE